MDLAVEPAQAAFAGNVTPRAQVAVDGTPVSDIPVVFTEDGYRMGSSETDRDGISSLDFLVPADIPDGDASVVAFVPFEDRALAGINASSELFIRPTPTRLTIEANQSGSGEITVRGRLSTESGMPVESQPVSISFEGVDSRTIETVEAGEFRATISVPAKQAGEEDNLTLAVSAAYAGIGSNLRHWWPLGASWIKNRVKGWTLYTSKVCSHESSVAK